MASETVCVTGASGFIASWLVKKLLEKGYNVRATVRDPSNKEKSSHLLNLPHAPERLRLVKADLLVEGSFHEAIQGCSGVFHTASPVFLSKVSDPETELIDPAVKGTLNVLKAVKDVGGVRRIIVTSSMAAVRFFANWHDAPTLDESNWSDPQYCADNGLWYHVSKTKAELLAWDYARSNDLDLVVINPTLVVGKLLQPAVNASSEVILKYLTGERKFYPNDVMGWVHVEDVADAHILAYERPEAEGRYLCIAEWRHWRQIVELLHQIEPSAPVTNEASDNEPEKKHPRTSNKKLRDLGIKFKSVESMVADCVASLKENSLY